MVKLFILLIAIVIIGTQIMQKRLLTSVTIWVGCYCCYFLIAPLLLNDHNDTVDYFAVMGISSFLAGYIFVRIMSSLFPFKCHMRIGSKQEQLSTKRYRTVCDYALFFTIVFLMLALGRSGLLSFTNGQLAAKDYLIRKEGIFVKLYSATIDLTGYMILFLFIKDEGRVNRKFIVRLVIYGLIILFFCYTRATLILLFTALFLYKLRKERPARQILVMFILIVSGTFIMVVMGIVRVYGVSGLYNLSMRRIWNNLTGSIDFTFVYKSFQQEIEHDVRISALVYLKPFFMVIPRSIWNDKPLAATIQILSHIDPGALARGYSEGFTILGEGYAVLGKKGIVILPFLWSIVCAALDEIYVRKVKNRKDTDLMTCSYVIFMSYTVIQGHRMGSDAVMVVFIIAICWLYVSSKIKLTRIKLGFKITMKRKNCNVIR